MKSLRTMLILAMLLAALPSAAQHLTDIPALQELFGSKSPMEDADRIIVSGKEEKSLAKRNLDYFQSVTVRTPEAMAAVNKSCLGLTAKAIDRESSVSRGIINYAFLSLPPCKDTRRYVFVFSDGKKTVAMYMEGKASFNDIKKMIKK